MVIRIFEGYMLERNASMYIPQGNRPLLVKNIHRRVHQLRKALDSRHSSLELLRKFDNSADCRQKRSHIHGIGH